MPDSHDQLLGLAAQIASAYAGTHGVTPEGLTSLIRDVYNSLASVKASAHVNGDAAKGLPKSVQSDHLVCLEDGLSMKMLKRHLLTVHNMTPEQYREKWNLPPDYPMVAPDYAKVRSNLAKQSGLGKKQDPAAKAARIHGGARRG